MTHEIRTRTEIPLQHTWDVASVFPSDEVWNETVQRVLDALPRLEQFKGRLGDGAETLLDWFQASETLFRQLGAVQLYASMRHNVDTADPTASAMFDCAMSVRSRVAAATAFAQPEILAIGRAMLERWSTELPGLTSYDHYFDLLECRRAHVRSTEVEELLGMVGEPFSSASGIHRTLTDTDLHFPSAENDRGDAFDVEQGNINALLTDPNREVRRTAWESYADAHLAMKNTMANCLATGVKQDVFMARARRYPSSLQASLEPNQIPVEVFYNLIETYRTNLPVWHRYWRVRREALGYDTLHVYDIKAPLTEAPIHVPYEQAVEWIVEGMQPLGHEYTEPLRRGAAADRWVDIYPNKGKRSGAYSHGSPGTHPFILMSYNDDLFSMSTLAHELGHSLHSYFSWQTQPFVYSRYGLFVAETASNFNQAMVRAHLMNVRTERDFQIALIEEAMSNFHRYFFIMPALARFELEVHERAERGDALTADSMISLMADLFQEGYGDEVAMDRDRVGITWAQFSGHLYANFYVYQYATGISAANALAQGVLRNGPEAARRYLSFLRAGGSVDPLEALKMAGVDMTSPEPVQAAFDVLSGLVDRLTELLQQQPTGAA